MASKTSREQILQAALIVFTQKGYAGTKMIEIARQAKINIATVYRFFESKEVLFTALNRPDLNFPDQKELSTRRKIVKKALEIFSQKGFSATTMDEIALASGFSKPAIYFYFPSKEALFSAVLEKPDGFDLIQRSFQQCLDHQPVNLEEMMTNLAATYFSFFQNRELTGMLRIVLAEGVHNPEISKSFHEQVVKVGSQNVVKFLMPFFDLQVEELTWRVQAFFGSLFSWGVFHLLMASPDHEKVNQKVVANDYARLFLFGFQGSMKKEKA